jgi:peptidoglycan/xylan/chitin deacetylase (PgdA/CDA1 family)
LGRVFGLALLLTVFAGAGFLLTCQKNPRGTTHSSAPHRATQGQSTPISHHKRHRAKPVEKPVEAPADSAASTPETAAATQGTQSTEQPVKVESPKPVNTGIELPRAGHHPPPAVVHTGLGEVARGSSGSTRVAVTFDAGADSRPASKILDVLARHGVHATFFLTGKWIEKNPGLARRIIAEGHEIGNHTYSHERLTGLSSGEIAEEVDRTEQLVLQITGHSTKPYARVPYGARDKRVLSVLSQLGYRSIYWDVDCWDSVKKGITSAQIETRVLGKIRNGSIVLMHCGSQPTADALDDLLRKLESEGYSQSTVSGLLGG